MANRLALETSPYLRQHQNNPVDWYPWGQEALERARRENKPILLSVGYSACHWCHVMAHESFENPEIARQMNQDFICIKVDREERPDLDQIYQNVAQALTHGGGWPLTVFLTPDLKPFYGGTYFPPEDKFGRAGFKRVLTALHLAYQNDPEAVAYNAQKLTEAIAELETLGADAKRAGKEHELAVRPTLESFKAIADQLLSRVDWEKGGLGAAPKFPNPMIFSFLWRFGLATDHKQALEATRLTLSQMADGGIYDHLGGGFSRYSVDDSWSVPHFEKMLYDNALLLKLYSEVLLTSTDGILSSQDRDRFLQVISETSLFVLREMTLDDGNGGGGFYSAQDADSEGEEGKFFVWDRKELSQHLSEVETRVFSLRYGVTDQGNFEKGKTVLAVSRSVQDLAQGLGLPESEIESLLASAKLKLFQEREKRVRPGLDDKILTSWNGLMISGMAWASQALIRSGKGRFQEIGERAWKAADRAFEFICKNLRQSSEASEDRLFSHYHSAFSGNAEGGKGRMNAYLDDYAFMAMAALDLSRWEGDAGTCQSRISQAQRWIQTLQKHFIDPQAPGYFFTSDDHEALLQRPKTLYDQAIPAGTSVTLGCRVALSALGLDDQVSSLEESAKSQLQGLFPSVLKNPYGYGEFCNSAWLDFLGPVTVSGLEAGTLIRHPHVFQNPGELLKETPSQNSKSQWVICHQKTCSLPIRQREVAQQQIRAHTLAP